MFMRTYVSFIIVVIFSAYCYKCLKVVPERTSLPYVNEKYFINASTSVRRASKRGAYIFNMQAYSTKQLGNNVTVDVALYEYSKYNQYVRTYIELSFKLCDLILKDRIIGAGIRSSGVTECPMAAGFIAIHNVTFNADAVPFDISFERGKTIHHLRKMPEKELMAIIEVVVLFQKTKQG